MAKKLEEYRNKRDFERTDEPEPKASRESGSNLRFVVQHHIASHDHFDFRLELDGVLKSWAIPKGPSLDTHDKRLAVQVEDHPLDYRTFEGTIPKGEYGGGTVMVWDVGTWEPLEDPRKGLEDGALKFTLKGKRLKGSWALVHIKPRKGEKDRNWLLIKEKDEFAGSDDVASYTTSVLTGRTMDEIAEGVPDHPKPQSRAAAPKTDYADLTLQGVAITHPEKPSIPEAGIRKGDIATYYDKVAARMLPYIQGRLISAVRCPRGIDEPCFFKKHPQSESSGIRTVSVKGTDGEKDDYFYIEDASGLMSEVQLNTIEFHPWGSSYDTLEHPDTMVFDLDPDPGVPLDAVRQGAHDVKSLLDKLSLVSFVKTSGGKGYHVVVPFKPTGAWDAFKAFAQNVAKLMEATWPDRYTSNSRKLNRAGRIYVDWQRNGRGATSVAPYSVRARSKAAVSTPITWAELYTVEPDQITMEDALERLAFEDPWAGYFEVNQELTTG